MSTSCWAHRFAAVNGIRLHYVEAGTGPLVVLLHGFPEFWYSWRRQIPALAAAGFRVIALDMRGYNESDKPAGVASYKLKVLARDVVELIHHAGVDRAHVVGHDWGGVVAWEVAARHPDAVDKLAVLNAPHPAAYRRELRRFGQVLKSWYVFLFQLPRLPEWLMRFRGYRLMEQTFRYGPARPEAFSADDIWEYKRALSHPGALTATINYYRAGLRYFQENTRDLPPIAAPTLLIWGERDPYVSRRVTQDLQPWVPNLHLKLIPDAGHWVQNEDPESVNQLILEFLGRCPKRGQETGG